MNSEIQKKIHDFLDDQGLTFGPLREEMTDHLITDWELQLSEGLTPDLAWQQVASQIPENHFKQIQNQTMESINKRINFSRMSSYLALALLTLTSAFKLLHLPGTTLLLFISCIAIALAFVVSSISGIMHYREKKGAIILGATVASILLFLASWVFIVLQLPGAALLKVISIASLVILFPALTLNFSNQNNSENHILTYLHSRHSDGIERFLMVLLGLSIVLKLVSIVMGYPPQIAWVMQVFVICAAGLNYFALTWHSGSNNAFSSNAGQKTVLVVLFIVSLLPALGVILAAPIRVTLATSFYLVAGAIAISRPGASSYSPASYAIYICISVFYLIWAGIQFGWIGTQWNGVVFGLPTLLLFLVGLGLSRKNTLLRMYMIMVVAHLLFEYPLDVPLI